jgi:hypothetical protein
VIGIIVVLSMAFLGAIPATEGRAEQLFDPTMLGIFEAVVDEEVGPEDQDLIRHR